MGFPATQDKNLFINHQQQWLRFTDKSQQKELSKHNKEVCKIRNLIKSVQPEWDLVKFKSWFNEPCADLGYIVPSFLVVMGRGQKVIQYIESVIYENGDPNGQE